MPSKAQSVTRTVFYRTLNVEGLEIFYREAGPRDAPTVLLLHGFPSSSHMYRNLIPSWKRKRIGFPIDHFATSPL